MIMLFPADVLRPRRVDEHFAGEADAAREAGIPVALVDHDAVARGDAAEAVIRVPGDATAIYRGWMLSSDRYADFDAALPPVVSSSTPVRSSTAVLTSPRPPGRRTTPTTP